MKTRAALFILLAFLWGLSLEAHIGSPNVFFEGKAGGYSVHVVVRPPQVVPGLAEITVRTEDPVQRVSVLPIFSNAGRKGAPPPDEGRPVRGETNLYSAALWLMKPGAYSVEVNVEGPRGKGTLVVPVNSVATNTRPMARGYGVMLAALGLTLFFGALKIAQAMAGESKLEPGIIPTAADRQRGWMAMVLTAAILSLLLLGGRKWWNIKDREYRNESLYHMTPVTATVRLDHDQQILTLQIQADYRWTPILPDHEKMMHLFLIRNETPEAFAHLHPAKKNATEFEAPLPPLPAGTYQLYADVTHEDGFSETLATNVAIPAASRAMETIWLGDSVEPICSPTVSQRLATNLFFPPDPDDSWHLDNQSKPGAQTKALSIEGQQAAYASGGYQWIWENPQGHAQDEETSLRFRLLAPDGQPAAIEPYLGMAGHAVVQEKTGVVFAHIHPAGTFSMAAQEFFINGKRSEETAASAATNSPSRTVLHTTHTNVPGSIPTISFPYAFPRAGAYRLWVQTRSQGRILTGVFSTVVAPPK